MKHNYFLTYFHITLGVCLIALSYYFLFLPLDIVTGGVTGVVVICKKLISNFSPSILIYILNGILLIFGWIFIGKDFLLKTIYGSLLLPTVIGILELFKVPYDLIFSLDTHFFKVSETGMSDFSQIILAIVFGSAMMGAGLGLCFRNNASTGGMDIVQKIIAKFFHFPYSKTVYVTDGIVVLLSLFVFGVEKTMYALISIILIGIVVDYVHMGGAARRTGFIISKKNDVIQKFIIEELGRGVTIVPAIGGYSGEKYDMLVCTLSKDESYVLLDLISEVDPAAFTFYVAAKEVFGDGFE